MSETKKSKTTHSNSDVQAYLSPKDLAARWSCSSSTARRIAERNAFTRFYFGEGRNGLVRYAIGEVLAFEDSRGTPPSKFIT